MLCSPPLFFNKMKNFIIFLLFFITNFQNNGVLSKNRFNVIADAKNSRIYRGPKNPKSQRDLSSFILRAKTTSIPSVKYFTGSPKPVWDDYDDYYQGEIYPTKFHTVECSPGKSCSQTIPLWNDPMTNEVYNHPPPPIIGNNVNKQLNSADYYKKSTFRPLVKSTTTTTTTSSPSTLGVSVASIYNQKWPSSSQISFSNQQQEENLYNLHHQSNHQSQNHPMTSSPSYTQFEYSPIYADTIQEPVYNKYATNRYDPFIYHTENKKVSKARRKPLQNRSSSSRLAPVYQPKSRSPHSNTNPYNYVSEHVVPNHYSHSTFGISSEPIVSSHDMFRSSLTWKNDKPPSELQHTSSTRLNYHSQSQYSNNNRRSNYEMYSNRRSSPNYENSFNRRNNFDYDNYQDNYREASSVQHSRYFPGTTFTTNRDQEAYYNQPAEPVVRRNKPSRNYFPVKNNDENYDDLDRNDFVEEEELPNPYVGEEQQVIAGYTVNDSGDDPNEYLASTYLLEDQYNNPDLAQWYDDLTASTTKKPYYQPRITTVKPWTSLDIAKPSWEDSTDDQASEQQPEHNNHHDNPSMTYGAWNKDNLKLEAVPFSRATDGKERKWVLLNSTVKKRKVIIPSNARNLEINENVGGFQVVPPVQ